ncbi:MAG: DUF3791 domain-containing protein [Defluviitaleaceae bacterium]|nr:DUF3791 domain-containing protein [Defluviitaleaceae bacterium]
MHTEADRAVWLVHVIYYTADELQKPVTETARLLERHGFVEKVLAGYDSFHTQGFEYMAELLTAELANTQQHEQHVGAAVGRPLSKLV